MWRSNEAWLLELRGPTFHEAYYTNAATEATAMPPGISSMLFAACVSASSPCMATMLGASAIAS